MNAIKISYVPEHGMITNYGDCEAVAPDGSRWRSVSNRWRMVSAAPVRNEKTRNPAAPMFGVFGFFVSLAIFATPVGMSFGDPAVGIPILFGISCACAAVFYRVMR